MHAFLSFLRLMLQPLFLAGKGRAAFSCMAVSLLLLTGAAAQAGQQPAALPDVAKAARTEAAALPLPVKTDTPPKSAPEAEKDIFSADELLRTARSFTRMVMPVQSKEQPSLQPVHGGVYVDTRLTWLTDPSGKLGVTDILPRKEEFRPLNMLTLPHQAASLWLRLSLAPVQEDGEEGKKALLDLGSRIPGSPQVWTVAEGGTAHPVPADEHGLFALNEVQQGGEVLIRLEGLPDLWFKPVLRTTTDALNAPEKKIHSMALAMLTVLLMLAFVRSITERGDGRIWAGLFAGAALLQAFWGIPATPDGSLPLPEMPGIVAVAVALMLLPHVGRSIMRTRLHAPALDILLLCLVLPGAALALLPVLPEQIWLVRFIGLWPLGAVFSLLPALIMLFRRQHGSLLFTLACLAMTGGAVAGLWGLEQGIYAPLWGQAPLIGVCVAALLLAAAPRSAYVEAHPVRLPSPADTLELEQFGTAREPAPREVRLHDVEERLREPLDVLMRQCCVLDRGLRLLEEPAEGESPLPREAQEKVRCARHDTAEVLNAAAALAEKIIGMAFDPPLPASPEKKKEPESSPREEVFELRRMVSQTFAAVQNEAAEKNLGLSWYIAPHIALRYRGEAARLSRVLEELLNDAVRATDRGNVCLRVRREDSSANPGHLRFTIADTGHGAPPARRSAMALAHAWELASAHGGDLTVDSSPEGVSLSFSLNCVALDAEGQAVAVPPTEDKNAAAAQDKSRPLIILASDHSLDRQMFAWQLRSEGHETWEARSCAEAVELYKTRPASLVLLDGHMPDDDIVQAVADIRRHEGEHSLPLVPLLGLALSPEQAELLRQAGCDHLLLHPLERQELCSAVKMLLAGDSMALQMLRRRSALNGRKKKAEAAAMPSADPRPLPKLAEPARPRLKIPEPCSAIETQESASSAKAQTTASADLPLSSSAENTEERKTPLPPVKMPEAPLIPPHPSARAVPVPFPVRRLMEEELPVPPLEEPQPKKRGWFMSLFKPEPKLTAQDASALSQPSAEVNEWVGEPSPVTEVPELSLDGGSTAPEEGDRREGAGEESLSAGEELPEGDSALHLDLPDSGATADEPLSLGTPAQDGESEPLSLEEPEKEEIIELTEDLRDSAVPASAERAGEGQDIVNLTPEDMVTPGPEISPEAFLSRLSPDGARKQVVQEMRLEDLAAIRDRLHEALTGGDVLKISRSAMQLGRCAAAFGLHSLTDMAGLLQECALAQDVEAVRVLMPTLDQTIDRELPPELRWTKEI